MNFENIANFFTDDYKEIHLCREQIIRIQKAKKTKAERINKKNCTAIFIGSSLDEYKTSINNCSCWDFSTRQKPCKHMYKLAIELGLLSDDILNETKFFDSLENLSPAELKALVAIMANNSTRILYDDTAVNKLIANGICKIDETRSNDMISYVNITEAFLMGNCDKMIKKKKPVNKIEEPINEIKNSVKKLDGLHLNFTSDSWDEKEEFWRIVIDNGGIVTTNVSKKTSYLITGSNASLTKLEKAKEYNVPVISMDEFKAMICDNLSL